MPRLAVPQLVDCVDKNDNAKDNACLDVLRSSLPVGAVLWVDDCYE